MFGKPVYAITERNAFGVRFVSGIVTGVRYTEDKPVYEVSFGKDKWWVTEIAETKEKILRLINLPDLERIKETHGLKIKYE